METPWFNRLIWSQKIYSNQIVRFLKLQPDYISSNWKPVTENLIIVSITTCEQEYCFEMQVNHISTPDSVYWLTILSKNFEYYWSFLGLQLTFWRYVFVADFEALSCQVTRKFIRCRNAETRTDSAIKYTACYALAVFDCPYVWVNLHFHIKLVKFVSFSFSVCVACVLACFNFFLLSVGEKFWNSSLRLVKVEALLQALVVFWIVRYKPTTCQCLNMPRDKLNKP